MCFNKPKTPKIAPIAPPVTETATEVTDAQRQQALNAQKRRGMQATLLSQPDQAQNQMGNGSASLLG